MYALRKFLTPGHTDRLEKYTFSGVSISKDHIYSLNYNLKHTYNYKSGTLYLFSGSSVGLFQFFRLFVFSSACDPLTDPKNHGKRS